MPVKKEDQTIVHLVIETTSARHICNVGDGERGNHAITRMRRQKNDLNAFFATQGLAYVAMLRESEN